ncbi:hypothetical protein NK55_05345 [Thermosynechococcus sp. NK55a]|uniref:FeoC-like transcriptional regulator n=1 Tax=unclassified Thermosynechococcus TaxID=2622553 RepID=UPI0003D8A835|nr:hypothetical protein NK55_05345 [Thermosynechococcus sp. NK55a]
MLLELQDYIKKRQVVSIEELVNHFRSPPSLIEPMIEQLIAKGRVQKITPSHCSSCQQCGSQSLQLYEWRMNHVIFSNDQSPK